MAVDHSTLSELSAAGALGARDLSLLWLTASNLSGKLPIDRPLTLGRDADCDVRIVGPSTSRRHAQIVKDGPLWIIRDLGSKNGVLVDGVKVGSALLQPGTVIRVGDGVGIALPAAKHGDDGFRVLAAGLLGGQSLSLVARQAQLAATSALNVVLEAESGSGKECFARALHTWSRCPGPFVPINCAALPQNLAEAELFGYQRGAFTGAERNHTGYFRAAHGGTLFLDEILELPPTIQAKLLRAVERREVVPLGATHPIPISVRIVTACQVPMAEAADAGRIRPDLFARLNGITLRIPPLRERREDILPLFFHFLQEAARLQRPDLDPTAIEALCVHHWPLNVRELEAVAHRLAALHPNESSFSAQHVANLIGRGLSKPNRATETPAIDSKWDGFVAALATTNGNVVRAAEAVGISRQRAYRLIARHPEFDVSSLRRADRCNH